MYFLFKKLITIIGTFLWLVTSLTPTLEKKALERLENALTSFHNTYGEKLKTFYSKIAPLTASELEERNNIHKEFLLIFATNLTEGCLAHPLPNQNALAKINSKINPSKETLLKEAILSLTPTELYNDETTKTLEDKELLEQTIGPLLHKRIQLCYDVLHFGVENYAILKKQAHDD